MGDDSQTVHATCVAFAGNGILITGAAGAGKSALGLQLMALGADLVADDRVVLSGDMGLKASCPPTIKGLIEARFVGILNAAPIDSATITLAVDLDSPETDRIPKRRKVTYLGYQIPLLYRVESIHFAPALAQALRHGIQ